MKTSVENSYDAIVIGSGWGGMTTASLLAQLGKKRVLVLERHFKLGGFTHSFRRKKYEWDVGVHYVGQMHKGTMARRLMDAVTRNGVQWKKMGSPFERFLFPDGTFEVPENRHAYQQRLIERFPAQRRQIESYFSDLCAAAGWIKRWAVTKLYGDRFSSLLTLHNQKLARQTTAERLLRFEDPLLRAFLAAQWPDYGSPPDESAFALHSIVTADFFNGASYPVGGAQKMSACAAQAVKMFGGDCLVNHPVKRIEIENGRAVGVITEHKGKEHRFTASQIVSNAGAWTTFGKLVPEEHCQQERERLTRIKTGVSALILFVGLKDDPRKHGFDEANNWIYDQLNHHIHTDTMAMRAAKGEAAINSAFVSFGSLRNPGQEPHTAQIISLCKHVPWDQYDQTLWMRRGSDYESAKASIAEDMLRLVEKYMPGFKSLVDFHELSTPATVKSLTGHADGMIYGQACDVNRIFRDDWRVGTSLKNLFLTGSDVGTPGINGAMVAGMLTAGRLLGPLGMPRIFRRAYAF